MFTGIIRGLGTIIGVVDRDKFREIVVDVGECIENPNIGASVSVDGVCLTITAILGSKLTFEAMQETLARSTIGNLKGGDRVNIEMPLKMGDEFGGHIVLGHVDGMGEIIEKHVDGENVRMRFRISDVLIKNIVDKGSIAIDGISLTVCDPSKNAFDVWLLPLTLERTTLGFKSAGDRVNIETDHGQRQFDIRPWGRFDVLEDAGDCKVKRLTIDAGKRISYQRHQKRTEHWTIVAGVANVTLDGVTTRKVAGETVVIEKITKHRLANPGIVPLVVIEVQLGTYFGEDDIERFDDDFGRA